MSSTRFVEEVGCWRKENILGAGGFGYVILWRNKVTNDTIALKECRLGNDTMTMNPKLRSRWKLEVDMMSRLNHPNVVKAIPVPPELDVPPTELPLLAMEFCSNGDLRKVSGFLKNNLLSRPENCCGLKEKHVRLIMKHVSSAVNYLHSNRIIHRDLKPENIVIQDQNGRVVYKLIDLGYAKELDQGSLCTSFVGTLQYLAPELIMAKKYSCTVDYWSLGLVTHEIITGARPFLPDKSPAEWIPIIRQKNSTQIRAYLDEDKNIVFSTEIAPFHYISNTFKKDVEEWLRLMLDWNPEKRGRNESVTSFSLLETILSKKIITVFCVETLRLHSFPMSMECTLEEFSMMLEVETKIPIGRQEIILPNGHLPDSRKGTNQFVVDLEEEEFTIYLFDSKSTSSISPSSITFIPPAVENMMRNPCLEVDYIQQRTVWAEAVYLCQQECMLVSKVMQAFKSTLINLLTKISYVHKGVSLMTAEMNKLLAKGSLFKCSLQRDIKGYEKQSLACGFNSPKMYSDWKSTLENVKQIDLLRQKVLKLDSCSSNVTGYAVELQKSPYAKSKLKMPIEEIHEKILELYAELRKRPKEQRRIFHNNTDMVGLLCASLQHSHSHTEDLLSHIRRVKEIEQDVDDIQPQIINLSYEISEWDVQIDRWQSQRQREIWSLFDNLNKELRHREEIRSSSPLRNSPQPQSNSPNINHTFLDQHYPDSAKLFHGSYKLSSLKSKPTPPIIIPAQPQNKLRANSQSPSFSIENSLHRLSISSLSSHNNLSLSTVIDFSREDTRRVQKENADILNSVQTMIEKIQSYKDSGVTDELK